MKVRVTQDQQDKLLALKDKTGLEPGYVGKLAANSLDDLKTGTIKQWMSGKEKLAPIGLVDDVIEFWSSIREDEHISHKKKSTIEKLKSLWSD